MTDKELVALSLAISAYLVHKNRKQLQKKRRSRTQSAIATAALFQLADDYTSQIIQMQYDFKFADIIKSNYK